MIDDELQNWIDKSLNETATAEEAQALEERLLGNSAARDHYLNEVYLHSSLRRRFSVDGEQVPSLDIVPNKSRRELVLGVAIAASLLLVAEYVGSRQRSLIWKESMSAAGSAP